MAGERTPDTSDHGNTSGGSSDNDISLREHMQRQLDSQNQNLLRLMDEHRRQLDERYATQTKALDAAFKSAESAVQAALNAAETAVQKAEMAADKRFESVNEFRGQLSDQAARFMSRDESIARHDRTQEQIKDNAERYHSELAVLRDRHDKDVSLINSRLDLTQGRSSGMEKFWGYIVGAIGLAGGIVGLILTFNN